MAYRAFEKQTNSSDPSWNDSPYSAAQQFFIHFAQSWCSNKRPEAVKHMLSSNEHTPNRYRVIGSLQNFNRFAEAFRCEADTPMNPVHKCRFA